MRGYEPARCVRQTFILKMHHIKFYEPYDVNEIA